jgi:hypothetical protein
MVYMVARNRRLSVELKHIDIIKTGRVYKFLPVVDVLEVPNSLHFLLATGEYETMEGVLLCSSSKNIAGVCLFGLGWIKFALSGWKDGWVSVPLYDKKSRY